MFREFAYLNKLPVPDIKYHELLDDQLEELTGSKIGMVKSAVDQLLEELSLMVEKDEVKEGDYKTLILQNGISVLAINFKKVYRDFKVYAKKTNYEGDMLDEISFNKMFVYRHKESKRSWNQFRQKFFILPPR